MLVSLMLIAVREYSQPRVLFRKICLIHMSQNMSYAATICVRHRHKEIGKGDLEFPK